MVTKMFGAEAEINFDFDLNILIILVFRVQALIFFIATVVVLVFCLGAAQELNDDVGTDIFVPAHFFIKDALRSKATTDSNWTCSNEFMLKIVSLSFSVKVSLELCARVIVKFGAIASNNVIFWMYLWQAAGVTLYLFLYRLTAIARLTLDNATPTQYKLNDTGYEQVSAK